MPLSEKAMETSSDEVCSAPSAHADPAPPNAAPASAQPNPVIAERRVIARELIGCMVLWFLLISNLPRCLGSSAPRSFIGAARHHLTLSGSVLCSRLRDSAAPAQSCRVLQNAAGRFRIVGEGAGGRGGQAAHGHTGVVLWKRQVSMTGCGECVSYLRCCGQNADESNLRSTSRP